MIEEDTVLHAYVPVYACTHIHTCGHKHTLYVRTKISEVILIFYKQKWGGSLCGAWSRSDGGSPALALPERGFMSTGGHPFATMRRFSSDV